MYVKGKLFDLVMAAVPDSKKCGLPIIGISLGKLCPVRVCVRERIFSRAASYSLELNLPT